MDDPGRCRYRPNSIPTTPSPTSCALPRWQFWIDRGGTFTDVVDRRPNGQVEELGHIAQAEMAPGDVFEIHTPGGGFGDF